MHLIHCTRYTIVAESSGKIQVGTYATYMRTRVRANVRHTRVGIPLQKWKYQEKSLGKWQIIVQSTGKKTSAKIVRSFATSAPHFVEKRKRQSTKQFKISFEIAYRKHCAICPIGYPKNLFVRICSHLALPYSARRQGQHSHADNYRIGKFSRARHFPSFAYCPYE